MRRKTELKKIPVITTDELLAAQEEAEHFRRIQKEIDIKKDDVVPEGFKTINEWAAVVQMTPQHAGLILRDAFTKKRAERKSFRVGGRMFYHYRLLK